MAKKEKNIIKLISTVLMAVILVGFCALLVVAYFQGHFKSEETMRAYVAGFGFWGWLALTVIQALQVVLPILPGFLGCMVGGALFGWWGGFLTNYIGISAGSLIAFIIARKCGKAYVDKMFPGKRYQRISQWAASSKSYTVTLFLAILLPLFPDDFFCYFSGITNMTFKKYTAIILIAKPWCILVYSLISAGVVAWL